MNWLAVLPTLALPRQPWSSSAYMGNKKRNRERERKEQERVMFVFQLLSDFYKDLGSWLREIFYGPMHNR